MIKLKILRWRDYPGGPSVISSVLKCGRGRQKNDALNERLHWPLLPLKIEDFHEPRNVSGP